jgi:hypothetical protein
MPLDVTWLNGPLGKSYNDITGTTPNSSEKLRQIILKATASRKIQDAE